MSFLFFTFPFFQDGEVKIKKFKTKMEKGKLKTKPLCRLPPPPPTGLAWTDGIFLRGSWSDTFCFLRKLLDTDMPCD